MIKFACHTNPLPLTCVCFIGSGCAWEPKPSDASQTSGQSSRVVQHWLLPAEPAAACRGFTCHCSCCWRRWVSVTKSLFIDMLENTVSVPFTLNLCVHVARSQPQRSLGKEDEAKEEEGLFSGWSGQAGAEGHEWCGTGEEEHGGMKKEKST